MVYNCIAKEILTKVGGKGAGNLPRARLLPH